MLTGDQVGLALCELTENTEGDARRGRDLPALGAVSAGSKTNSPGSGVEFYGRDPGPGPQVEGSTPRPLAVQHWTGTAVSGDVRRKRS